MYVYTLIYLSIYLSIFMCIYIYIWICIWTDKPCLPAANLVSLQQDISSGPSGEPRCVPLGAALPGVRPGVL